LGDTYKAQTYKKIMNNGEIKKPAPKGTG